MRAAVFLSLLVLAACADHADPAPATLELAPDSAVHFPAIGDSLQLQASAYTADGDVLGTDDLVFTSRDTAVLAVSRDGWIRSRGDGTTWVVARSDDLADSLRVTVVQARDSLVVSTGSTGQVLVVNGAAAFRLSCRAFDAAGARVDIPVSVSSRTGRVSGTSCDELIAGSSGHDTLTVSAGSWQATVPIVLAIRPRVLTDAAVPLAVDSLPTGSSPWAPTLYRAPDGALHLYLALYRLAPYPLDGKLGDLHRLVSDDDASFRYDGVALRRDPDPCSLQGTGIENVAIIPREDTAGWRMYFSAGSYDCFGWQVFSAVSDDGDRWVKEPGVRIPHGGVAPPEDPELPPWPAGEGMHIDPMAGGGWRMLVGAYQRIEPRENRFQVIEWRSADQLAWRYHGPVLTTRQVGPGARRSVYSPSIQAIAPGLRRMYFTGDDLPNGGSRIYTAVSTDGSAWQVEGVLLEGGPVDYFYSTIVDDLLVFVRRTGERHTLGGVRVETR